MNTKDKIESRTKLWRYMDLDKRIESLKMFQDIILDKMEEFFVYEDEILEILQSRDIKKVTNEENEK